MALVSQVQTDFTGGELSPRLRGRTDISRYASGGEELKNFHTLPHGGITRRMGTKSVAEVQDSSSITELIPFQFSASQTYMIEFGDLYVRFFTNNGQLQSPQLTVTGGSWAASVATITIAAGHTWQVGTKVTVAGVTPSGYDQVDAVITAVTATTFDYAVASDPGAWSAGGTVDGPYEITSPYTAAQVRDIKFTQSADILFLCHSAHQTQQLQRIGATEWQFVDHDMNDGPYLPFNPTFLDSTPTTIGLSAVTGGGVTFTASSIVGINDDTGFQTTDVGRNIRFQDAGGSWTWLTIDAWASTTVVTGRVRGPDASAITAVDTWHMGAWSDTTGWPETCVFHQERLWFGATTEEPQTVWSSETGNFVVFSPTEADDTVIDDNGLNFTIADNQVNVIRWLASAPKGLFIGTENGEFTLQGAGGAFDVISPTSVSVRRRSSYGSKSTVRPVQPGSVIMFVQRSGFKVREQIFEFEADEFVANDLTILADHITDTPSDTGIRQMTFQQEPYPIIWCALEDGNLVGMTYERSEAAQVFAWHQHVLGGTFQSGNPQVRSIATINTSDWDQTWMIVRRTINGATVQQVEYLADPFRFAEAKEDAIFVDASLTYDSTPTTTITGLDYLEGETVSVLADGAVHPDVVVSSGQITLNAAASVVQVGLLAECKFTSMPIMTQRAPFDVRGKNLQVYKPMVQFYRTLGGEIGDPTNTDPLVFRASSDPMDSSPPLFTGLKETPFTTGYSREPQLVYINNQPLPVTILSIIYEMNAGGV